MKQNNKNSGIWIDKMELPELVCLATRKGNKITSKYSGTLGGPYLSKIKGRGMEFAEVRPYQPGDDVRHIDWRVTARSGKPHTKLFREERERPVILVLDQSRSMFFGSRKRLKSVQAARLAALIGWRAILSGDRVGGVLFSENNHREFRPKSDRMNYLRLLSNITLDHNYIVDNMNSEDWIFNSDNFLTHALRRLRNLVQPGSLVYIFSDFSGYNEECKKHLFQLTKNSQVKAMLVIDPIEKNIHVKGSYVMSDGESVYRINTFNSEVRRQYSFSFKKFQEQLANDLRICRVIISNISTNDELNRIK